MPSARALLVAATFLAASSDGVPIAAADPPSVARLGPVPGTRFEGHATQDALGRRIVFYLSTARAENERLPLAAFIQGSGCDSVFVRRGDRVAGRLQNIPLEAAGGRARALAVEKPGVAYLDESKRPGTAEGCSAAFLAEHTLPRWAEAVGAAVRAALSLPGIDPTRSLVVGHSEGGIVAARVAAEDRRITHVASLAGGGPTQLFDLAEIARADGSGRDDPEARVREVHAQWARIQADPTSVTRFWKGHPYRRWASFLSSSVLESLLRTDARIYLAHGTADRAVPVAAFDVLRAELAARAKDVTTERIEGADHGFRRTTPSGPPAELRQLMGRVVDWFLR